MDAICLVLNLYWLIIIARMIFSWIRVEPDTPWASVEGALVRVTEPVLGPIRRVIPPLRMGAGYFDVSPIIILVVILIIC